MVQIVSIAFQLAGATILLLWSFKALKKESITDRCFVKGAYIERDENGNGRIDKKQLQDISKEALLNVFAFINLIIGYGVTFWEGDNLGRWCAILYTFILLACILGIDYLLACFISNLRFSQDIVLTSEEIYKKGVLTNAISSEIDEICK